VPALQIDRPGRPLPLPLHFGCTGSAAGGASGAFLGLSAGRSALGWMGSSLGSTRPAAAKMCGSCNIVIIVIGAHTVEVRRGVRLLDVDAGL